MALWAHLRGFGSPKVTQILSLYPDRTIKTWTIPVRGRMQLGVFKRFGFVWFLTRLKIFGLNGSVFWFKWIGSVEILNNFG